MIHFNHNFCCIALWDPPCALVFAEWGHHYTDPVPLLTHTYHMLHYTQKIVSRLRLRVIFQGSSSAMIIFIPHINEYMWPTTTK